MEEMGELVSEGKPRCVRRSRRLRVGYAGGKVPRREIPQQHLPSSWRLPSQLLKGVSLRSGSLFGCLAAHSCLGSWLLGSGLGNEKWVSLSWAAGHQEAREGSEVIFLPGRDSEGKAECSASWIHRLEEEGALTAPVPGVIKLGPKGQIQPAIYFCQ